MDSTVERNREAMLKKLASRNQKRTLDAAAAKESRAQKIDLDATEKAFLESSPSTLTMRTPLSSITNNKRNSYAVPSVSSPILSFDEKADKQIVALATWTNTVIGMDSTEELDLGATTAEACRRIQTLLATKKSDTEVEGINEAARRRYRQIFEKNDSDEIKNKCKALLDDSGIEESIRNLLSRDAVAIRDEHSVYNDLALQTNLLSTFFCFHPAWLKASLEAIFDTRFDTQPKSMIRALSQFILEQVFSNPKMLKNKKFAQGSGKPIITKPGRLALHRHFLEVVMKMMFLIETANLHRVIPNLTRVFTKSSQFKCLDDMFSALTKKLLTGSSLTFKKAFSKIGFTPNYRQSFFDNYDYQARGFSSFSDGLILAKLIETVGELPYGELLLKLRDPAGDRIRKLNNVKTVLQKMKTIGIPTEDITPEAIVGGKKESILSLLWSIVGVRVAKEKRVKMSRPMSPESESPKKRPRRSAVHDDMSSEVLKACKMYGRELNMEVLDLDTLMDGVLLDAIWRLEVPTGTAIQEYSGETLWEKVVSMAELELGIQRGLDQSVALFVKTFIERTHVVKKYNEKYLTVLVEEEEEETRSDKTFRVHKTVVHSEIHYEVVSPTREEVSVVVDLEDDNNQTMVSPNNVKGSFTSEDVQEPTADTEDVKNLSGIPMTPECPGDSDAPEETPEEREATTPTADVSQNLSGVLIIPDDIEASEEIPEVAKKSESFITEVVFTPGDDLTQPMETPKPVDFEAVTIKARVRDSEEGVPTVEDVDIQGAGAPEAAPEECKTREGASPTLQMDTTQPTTAPSTSTTSSVGYEMTDQQKQTEDAFRRVIEDQKRFVLENELNLVIEDEETANTPELRRILRKTKELKRKQEEVAKRLGAIERQAQDLKVSDEKENAFINHTTASDRSDAGHDVAMLHNESEAQNESLFEDKEKKERLQQEAATKIQKLVRGFLARRRFAMEIRDWREKMIVYNQILAQENEHLEKNEDDDGNVENSVQKKLQNCTLYGLTNDNLHVVHIAATIIDRLTELVPSLLNQFVIDLNGIKPIYSILAVADQGLAYTSILLPLLRVLQKSLEKVPEETSDDVIRPLLQKLSPRLVLLMCKHAQNQAFFIPIITSLIAIARRFPDKKVSHIDAQYAIRQTMRKVSDQEATNHLNTLRHITD